MEQVDIKRFLVESNPHWVSKDLSLSSELKILYRPQFERINQLMDKPQIVGLIGVRRVGKSVLMRQLMCQLAKENDPLNICQISFDEEIVGKNPDILEHIIEEFISHRATQKSDRVFFFVDEIQFVKNWQHILKRHYDRNQNIKFIISGSSSLFIKKKSTESLAGRIFEITVPPLNFWEYLILRGQHEETAKKLSSLKLDIDNLNSLEVFKTSEDIQIHETNLSSVFDEYLCRGQFPEIVKWSEGDAYEYLKNSIYKKTLFYDIPRIYQIRRPDELGFLYSILVRESANLIEINNLARDSGINRNTISTYLEYLKESLLHIQLPNCTSSAREQRRLLKKGYVVSPNFTTAMYKLNTAHPLWSKEAGHLAETFVANILWNTCTDALRFYRKQDSEVDFVISSLPGQAKEGTLIEVKYTNSIDSRDLKSLIAFAEKINSKQVVCITRNISKIEKLGNASAIFLPLWALNFGV